MSHERLGDVAYHNEDFDKGVSYLEDTYNLIVRLFVLRLPRQLDQALYLIREGRFGEVGHRLASRVYEDWLSYGLRRDLMVPFHGPRARIPISIREFRASDAQLLFPDDTATLPREERLEIAARRAHLEENIPTCYVAVDLRKDVPCYAQWLMGPEQNEKIQRFFGGRFPRLKGDEALLENAYTPLAYRGKGIMPAAMAMISERAVELGCRYVLTFVSSENVPSLKGCAKAGFVPFATRHDMRFLFGAFRRRHFSLLPQGFALPHETRRDSTEVEIKGGEAPPLIVPDSRLSVAE